MSLASGDDPRREPGMQSSTGWQDAGEPVVGRTTRPTNALMIVGAFAVLAVALFFLLESRRAQQTASLVTPVSNPSAGAALPPPVLDVPRPPVPVAAPEPVTATPAPVTVAPVTPPPPDMTANLHAPAVVVDLQASGGTRGGPALAQPGAMQPGTGAQAAKQAGSATAPASDPAGGGSNSAAAGPVATAGSTEQFAARASETVPEPAVATQLTNLSTTITQGATIPGILETALNSDLPGYTRAIVSRDVRAFDGKAVLIPKGSRLIGQYRNALSLGQSRVFVIWTRVIRPDGVSIQIGSPGGDALGRGGLTGDVNSHFFARFGGAILLSVLSTGTAAIAGTPSTQVTIGSPAAAAGAAASATIPTGSDIPPTIKVMQGEAITIFVARDLDFTGVKPVP